MAELFDDHSPLQLMAMRPLAGAGLHAGRAVPVQGAERDRGPNGMRPSTTASTAILGEDNGAYVFSLPARANRELPSAERFRVGTTTAIAGKTFNVASNEAVALVSAQGELPKLPSLGQTFPMVELRECRWRGPEPRLRHDAAGSEPRFSRHLVDPTTRKSIRP